MSKEESDIEEQLERLEIEKFHNNQEIEKINTHNLSPSHWRPFRD